MVGAGPVGLTAARLLADAEPACLVVERRAGPHRQPAAHVVNARTLEIFRQAGVDMAPLGGVGRTPTTVGDVHWVTTLGGELMGRLPYERQGDDILEVTPTPLRNLCQHRLEPLLAPGRDAAMATARPGRHPARPWRGHLRGPDLEGERAPTVRTLPAGRRRRRRARCAAALGIELVGPPRFRPSS